MKNERIVFMGTPEFAVATLDALLASGFEVCAVVTAPDRPAGRGRQLRSSAVKQRAEELQLPILQPEKLKDPEFNRQLDELDASLYVVVAFRMLPEIVWNKPSLGTINLHASLLPAYRGAAPINWAVANGEERTGVTTFRIQQEIDTGDLLLQEEIEIGENETAGEAHDRLMSLGADLMVRTVHGLFDATLHSSPQSVSSELPTAPKLNRENTHLQFERPAKQVHDMVRGMSPFPGAWCEWTTADAAPLQCKILLSRVVENGPSVEPGTLELSSTNAEGTRMLVSCGSGWIEVIDLQLEGRKRMKAVELSRGLRSSSWIKLR